MATEEEDFRHPSRWILSPRRGSRFVGRHERTRLRAKERRRRVFLFLLELIALTGLIGMFPPLRGMLLVTGTVAFLLAVYTGLVIQAARATGAAAAALNPADFVVVLPEAIREPEFEVQERNRRVLRIAAR